jgi:DNA-binding ferritin-like protein
MSGEDLKLDLERLRQLRDDLDAVVKEFKNADDFSDAVADATGHDSLHDHVRDFAHKWNDKRKSMTENVENLQQQIKAISDGFTQVDEGLAKALEDAAKEQGGTGGGGGPKPQAQ